MLRYFNNSSRGPVAFGHRFRVNALHVAAILSLAGGAAGSPSPALQVIVSNETVPPGGTVELKFSLSQPNLIATGELALDLDPTVFASATAASVFSANGDAAGVVQIQGLHVDVHFSSQNGGIGRLAGVPIVAVTAIVLQTAAVGKVASVIADPSGSQWVGPSTLSPSGLIPPPPYVVSVSAGTVTVGGTLSISSITPVGGVLPAGTVIQIQGTGFSNATTALINGASVSSVQVTGSQTISLILGGPTELTGKRISVSNPDGSEVDVFPFAAQAPVSSPGTPLEGALPILPLQPYTAAYLAGESFVLIRNPNATAVQLVADTTSAVGSFQREQSFTIPSGGSLPLQTPDPRSGSDLVIASAPVQIVQLLSFTAITPAYHFLGTALTAAIVPPLQVAEFTQDQSNLLSWVWQTGTAAPQAQTINVGVPWSFGQPDTDYTVSVATGSGGPWLSVTPSGNISCQSTGQVGGYPGGCAVLQVSANPASLAPGVYRGTVTITPVATIFRPSVEPAVIPVVLTVTASPITQTLIEPVFNGPAIVPPPGFFTGPVSLSAVTDGGGNWLSTSLTGTTSLFGIVNPTSVNVTRNTAGLAPGTYSGEVVATSSGSTLVIPVSVSVPASIELEVANPQSQFGPGTLGSLNLAVQAGTAAPPPQVVPVSIVNCTNPAQCVPVIPNDLSSVVVSVQSHSGGPWLSAALSQSQGAVVVSANSAGLGPGVYLGAVTLTAPGISPTQFPVVLQVQGGSPLPLVAGPALVAAFESQAGAGIDRSAGPSAICVGSGAAPLTFGVQVSTGDGGNWLTVGNTSNTTPACVNFSINAVPLAAGNYTGSIVFTSGTQSVSVPVTLTVAEPPGSPLLGAVASAAPETVGTLYPGEVIAIHGLNLEASSPSSSGVNVLIGGISAPIISGSPTLLTTVVPYEVARQGDVTVQVQNNSGSTATWDIPLVACATSATPASFQIGAAGGLVTIQLQADASCSWTVANLPTWASISGTVTGTGPASVALNVSANNGQSRNATISIAGFAVQLNQDAASGCTYTLDPGGQAFLASGGTGAIAITTAPGCQWTVGALPPWVTLTSPSSGLGSGTVTLQVLPNGGGDLTGAFTIGGQTFTVEQQSSGIGGLSFIGSMPHIAAEENWTTLFTLVNNGSAPALARLSLFGDPGGPLTLPLGFPQQSAASGPVLAGSLDRTIAANASLIVDSAGPQTPPVLVGSAQLAAAGSVDGFAIFHHTVTSQEAVVPLETRNASSYLLAFDNTNSLELGLAVQNVSAQSAIIPVVIRDDTGAVIGSSPGLVIAPIALPGSGHTSFVLSTQYPFTANIRGTIEFDTPAGGQISVLGLRFTPPNNALTTIPALANVGTVGGSIAHVVSGGDGWQTTFVLVNAGASAAPATLSFFDQTGAPLPLPLAFPQSGSGTTMTVPTYTSQLAAGATLVMVSSGTQPLLTGSAQLSTSGNVSGFVIFRHNDQEAVAPLENRGANAYIIAFDNTKDTATGVAVNSVSAQSVNVPVTIRDESGAQIATDLLNLAPNGHLAFTLGSDKYPGTANLRGTIEFDKPATGEIGALGIRMPAGSAHTFTTLPALAK